MTNIEIASKEITRKSWCLYPISLGLIGLSSLASYEKNLPLAYVVLGLAAAFSIYGIAFGIWVGRKLGQVQ